MLLNLNVTIAVFCDKTMRKMCLYWCWKIRLGIHRPQWRHLHSVCQHGSSPTQHSHGQDSQCSVDRTIRTYSQMVTLRMHRLMHVVGRRSGTDQVQRRSSHGLSPASVAPATGQSCPVCRRSHHGYRPSSHVAGDGVTQSAPPWRILFFGTDAFSARVLQDLKDNRSTENRPLIDRLDVVSNVGKTVVRKLATSAGLAVHDWPIPDVTGLYDMAVLASFGHLIPARVIRMFPHGIYNIHPSLLPRWRGAAPIVHTIYSGDAISGVSITKLQSKHFDVGGVVCRREVVVPDRCTSLQLRNLLAGHGGALIVDALKNIIDLPVMDQNYQGVTYACKVKSSMAYIDWTSQTCEDIDRQYRALAEFLPLRSELAGRPVKLLSMQSVSEAVCVHEDPLPGTMVYDKANHLLCIKCMNGWVGFESILIRKRMSALEFYNGFLSKTKTRTLMLTSIPNGMKQTHSV